MRIRRVRSQTFRGAASALAAIGRRFYGRGWAVGTSGNFSVVLTRQPLSLAITASGASKRALRPADIVRCDERGRVIGRALKKPSAETLLHVELARQGAGAVLHTHSVWSTMLSDRYRAAGGLPIEGYEMLKGLSGVTSHRHHEWIPILDNDQDMAQLARGVADMLVRQPAAHAFLLRRHGLYTWGVTLGEAERHVEILEFLFETIGQSQNHHSKPPEVSYGDSQNS